MAARDLMAMDAFSELIRLSVGDFLDLASLACFLDRELRLHVAVWDFASGLVLTVRSPLTLQPLHVDWHPPRLF